MKKQGLRFAAFIIAAVMITGSNSVFAEPAAVPEKKEQESIQQDTLYRSEELILKNGEDDIYGILYLPVEEKEQYPAVIVSHGFGGNHIAMQKIAQYFAEHGFAAYTYDFIGGSASSKSGKADGDMSHMSVLTEASDLCAVMDQMIGLSCVDAEHLFLLGQSQGGYVSAYVAAQRPEDIKALVLQFPAFALQDDCWERHGSVENVPETEKFMGQELGALYSLDAMSMDIYDVIGAYTGDVLICHGDNDKLVDLSYSERAAQVYENAELHVYEGAGHGFVKDDLDRFLEESLAFLEKHMISAETDTADADRQTAKETEHFSYRACEHRDGYLLQEDSYEATDAQGGYRHYVCSECGAEYSYETAPMIYTVNPMTGEPVTHQGASNPLYENWDFIPDGEPHVFWSRTDNEWRVYVYGSHDEDGETMCGYDQVLWSAPVYDMSSWRYEGVILEFHDLEKPVKLYAPDCDYDVNTDTYFMIANQAAPDNKSVLRAADNPAGPWIPEENLIEMRMRLAYDPAIYIEDGIIYIAGSAMRSGAEDAGREDILAAFEEDNYKIKHILSVSRLKGNLKNGFEVEETVFPGSDEKCYLAIYEGPSFGGWVEELGCYIMLYVSHEPGAEEGETYNSTIAYVYADDLMSEVWHYGENLCDDIIEYHGEETLSGNHGNVIYDTSGRYHANPETGEMKFTNIPTYMHGNNHGGMARINGVWYEFGHRPAYNGGAYRQGVADKMNLYLSEEGTPVIEVTEYTSSGVSDYLDAFSVWNANTTCYLVAGVGIPAAGGGEGQPVEEGFDQPYIMTTHDPEAIHASYITDIKSGSVIGYKYIGFGDDAKAHVLKMLVSREDGFTDGFVHVFIDAPAQENGGIEIGTVELTADLIAAGEEETSSDGTVWHWVSGTMEQELEGIHAVYLVFESADTGYICNFDQFVFE